MAKDLRELPRFDDALSYLYVQHARIDQHEKAIAIHDKDGTVPVPVASLAFLMLGPGTSITHAAVRALADNNCLLAWTGEQGVRLYAHSTGGTRSSSALLRQAALASNPTTRLRVVMRMYRMRFTEQLDPQLTLEQVRGLEGIRVREAYAAASRATGVAWKGRNYDRRNWASADPVNRALSAGNACLYGLVHAAMLSAGYSPAIGFIHTGKQLSFVYDIADLYKVDIIVPLAFQTAAQQREKIDRAVRIACRDRFKSARLMQRIIPDIQQALGVPPEMPRGTDDAWDEDSARPGRLWDPSAGPDGDAGVEGGKSYGGDDS